MAKNKEYDLPTYEGDQESLYSLERKHLAEGAGATPLLLTKRQEKVYNRLRQRFIDNRPEDVSDNVFLFMLMHFENRFAKRQQRNSDSYYQRLDKDTVVLDEQLPGLKELALKGLAYPDELLDVRELAGMGDIELGRGTFPFGASLEVLDELRVNTRDAIRDRGGFVFDPDVYVEFESFEVEATDRQITGLDTFSEAFLVVRSRLFGVLPDQTEIYERSSFILEVNKAFDGPTIMSLRLAVRDEGKALNAQIAKVVSIEDVARPLLKHDIHDIARPLSSTMYAVNVQTQREVKERIESTIAPHEAMPDSLVEALHEVVSNNFQAIPAPWPTWPEGESAETDIAGLTWTR